MPSKAKSKGLSHKEIENYILSMPNATLGYPFGEGVAVYRVKQKMFALIREGVTPVNLSLKSDPELAKVLVARYESVMPGYHLNKKHWISVVLSGQLSPKEIEDLIYHSYTLVNAS